jgi:hypothetical protein
VDTWCNFSALFVLVCSHQAACSYHYTCHHSVRIRLRAMVQPLEFCCLVHEGSFDSVLTRCEGYTLGSAGVVPLAQIQASHSCWIGFVRETRRSPIVWRGCSEGRATALSARPYARAFQSGCQLHRGRFSRHQLKGPPNLRSDPTSRRDPRSNKL